MDGWMDGAACRLLTRESDSAVCGVTYCVGVGG